MTLPPNTELVILSQLEVESLISKNCFDKLYEFKTLTCENLVNCLGKVEDINTSKKRKGEPESVEKEPSPVH